MSREVKGADGSDACLLDEEDKAFMRVWASG